MSDNTEIFTSWTRNLRKEFQNSSEEEIRKKLSKNSHSFSCLMENFVGDFNIGTMIRNANAFNAKEVFYYGKKNWNRRGAVGTHHYINVSRKRDISEVIKLKEIYHFVAIEIHEGSTLLYDYNWDKALSDSGKDILMIFGEEGVGITDEMMELADDTVEIPQYGSVPSMNVGTTSGIVMYDFCNKRYR